MIVICHNKECEYYDHEECRIVKDGFDTLVIGDDSRCWSKNECVFPNEIGQPAEMFVDGEWIKGKIVEGYRFRDGIVTIETEDGQRYWCGQARKELYREIKEETE